MNDRKINFTNKKILIYGFGKSGISCFNYLKKNNSCEILDDNKKNNRFHYLLFYIFEQY